MSAMQPVGLRRGLSSILVVLYGLGTTIGAGIYVLIGKVAGAAGLQAPVSFLLACGLAAFTAFSFAELSSRFPKSAGEAVYVHEGFGAPRFALLVGLLVASAGIVSAAAIISGAVGYLREFIEIRHWVAIAIILAGLGLIAVWGITQSVTVAAVGTVIEVGGLLLVIWGGREAFAEIGARWTELVPPLDRGAWLGICSGAVLAFYAFLGFEDMVNVAEETKDAERTMPRAIVATLLITSVLYVLLATVAVLALPVERLAESEAPLALLYRETTGASSSAIALIAILSVLNGALIQAIMASRVLYGLAAQGWLPGRFARIGRRSQTPVVATATVIGLIALFALVLPLVELAQLTSLIALVIFSLINFSLLRVKRRLGSESGRFTVGIWVPAVGGVVSAVFAGFQIAVFVGLA